MQTVYATHPDDVAALTKAQCYQRLVVDDLFNADTWTWVNTHYDRTLVGGVVLKRSSIQLTTPAGPGEYGLLEAREAVVFCVAGEFDLQIGSESWRLRDDDMLYLGPNAEDVVLSTTSDAVVFVLSAISTAARPPRMVRANEGWQTLGREERSKLRSVKTAVEPGPDGTSQITAGLVKLEPANVWHTMPMHVHDYSSEFYLYYDVEPGEVVTHLWGTADDTRTLMLHDRELAIVPPWSVHAGVGMRSYSFFWAMVGEPRAMGERTLVPTEDLR